MKYIDSVILIKEEENLHSLTCYKKICITITLIKVDILFILLYFARFHVPKIYAMN